MLALRPVHVSVSSPVHGTSVERTEGRYPCISGEVDGVKFGAWARCSSPDDGSDFTWMTIKADSDSDISSPRLWKNSSSPVSPIAQYLQGMQDAARDESGSEYEPSLKDIVVSPPERETPVQNKFGRREQLPSRPAMAARRLSRTESMDRGVFLLKIFSPFPSGPRRNSSIGKTSSRLAPKPELGERCGAVQIRESHECWSKEDNKNNTNHKRRILGRLRTFFLRKCYSFS